MRKRDEAPPEFAAGTRCARFRLVGEGRPQWSPLLGEWFNEPTQLLPRAEVPPKTQAGRWRAQGGRR